MCSRRCTRSSTRQARTRRRTRTRTRIRGQQRSTSTRHDAVHNAGTRRRHQPQQQTREVSKQKSSNTPTGEPTNTFYDCTTKLSNQMKNRRPTGGRRRSKFHSKAGTHRHHPTTDPSVRSPLCTSVHNPHWTPISLLTKKTSDRATPRHTTYSRSKDQDREPPLGTSRCGSQQLTSRRHSTQFGTAAYGRLHRNKALRSHTSSCSQITTTTNHGQ